MGMSVTGNLFYGIVLGNKDEGDLPQWMYESEDELYDDVSEALTIALGGPVADYDAEDWEVQLKAHREFAKTTGVSLIQYGNYEYSYFHYALIVSESYVSAWSGRGQSVDLDTIAGCAHSDNYDAILDEALTKLGMDLDTERGWVLAASYG